MALLTGFIVYAPLLIGFILAGESTGRDLRPSDHGLEFQISPPKGMNYPPEMMSFFNGTHSTSPTTTSTDFGMPKTLNSSDSSPSSWWGGNGGGAGRDHLRSALIVGSLVSGVIGVILLLASGLFYVFKYRKRKSTESSNDNHHNKLELVPSNP